MNDIRKNLQTIDGLEEQLITKGFELGSKLLGKSGSKIKPQSGPVTEIPPFDMNSPAAQAAAAARQAKQQPAIDRLQGIDSPSPTPTPTQKPKIRMQPGETYDDAVKRAQDQEAADSLQRVLKQPKRGPDYRSPYDDATPSGLEPLPPKVDTPSVTSAADSDILKGIAAATTTKPTSKLAWQAKRKLKQHAPDIATGAAAYGAYQNWDDIKDFLGKNAGAYSAEKLKKLNDYLFGPETKDQENKKIQENDSEVADPRRFQYDEKNKWYQDRLGNTYTPKEFEEKIFTPWSQTIESDPERKLKMSQAKKVLGQSQGQSLVGRALKGVKLLGKGAGWAGGIAGGAEVIAPDEWKPSEMWKRGVERWRQSDSQKSDTATTSAGSVTPATTTSTVPAAPTTTPEPVTTFPSSIDRTEPVRSSGFSPARAGRYENKSCINQNYLKEFKRYIDSV